MFPHISYHDIVLLADLTSRTLIRLRNASGENDNLARHLSSLLTALRHLQERAAESGDPVNIYSIRQDRASIVGGCWKIVNDLDITLGSPNETNKNEAASRSSAKQSICDFTLAIYIFLATTSPTSRIESEKHFEDGECSLGIFGRAVNSLVPTLIARAINEEQEPCYYVRDNRHVLAELQVTMPDIGGEIHSKGVVAYLDTLRSENMKKANAGITNAPPRQESFPYHSKGFGFTPSDPRTVFDRFMKEEGKRDTSYAYQAGDLPFSKKDDKTPPSSPKPTGPGTEEAEKELQAIYETLQDYQAQYLEFIERPPYERKIRERQSQTLEDHLERNVIEELDKVLLGENQHLRHFKKYLVKKAQDMLDNIEMAGNKAFDSRKRSRGA